MNCPGCGSFVSPGTSRCPYCGSACEETQKTVGEPFFNSRAQERKLGAGTDVYEANINSVMEIIAMTGGAGGSGTGFLISESGLAYTNTHVVTVDCKVAEQIVVEIAGEKVNAKVLQLGDQEGGRGDGIDAAIIKLDRVPRGASCVKMASSDDVKRGETVFAIGNSKGEGLSITRGIISDIGRQKGGKVPLFMADVAVNPGNSGGPLFNENGEVIAVCVSKRIDAIGMNYFIPINDVRREFRKWFF